MKKILLLLISFGGLTVINAQVKILKDVKIEFEKQVNQWATIQGTNAERMKDRIPQYSSTSYSFETDGTKSIYKMIPTENNANNSRGGFFFRMGGNDNGQVYTDFKDDKQVILKEVFEKTYLLNDTMRNFNWKITNQFREIAGFNCRRANAIIMDSVFVVAFYTDEILAPGGPESFGGLPGTILGLVINRLHTTWYAKSVSVKDVNLKDIVPPADKKADKTTREILLKTLKDRFQGPGNRGGFGGNQDMMIWNLMI